MDRNQEMLRYLQMEQEKLRRIINQIEARQAHVPEGNLRVVPHRDSYQYFHRKTAEDRSGSYIPAAEIELVKKLAQKQYDKKAGAIAKKQLELLDHFLGKYDPQALKKLCSDLSEARRALITPEELTDAEYEEQWQSREYTRKQVADDVPEHYTDKGERVRSKSEVLIANTLAREGIPYHYEYPLRVGGHKLHPDFLVLRGSDRKEFIWEHLGRMDDPDYQHKAYQRIREYEKNGIYQGEDLIVTEETSQMPLNLRLVRQKIRHYFG